MSTLHVPGPTLCVGQLAREFATTPGVGDLEGFYNSQAPPCILFVLPIKSELMSTGEILKQVQDDKLT